MNRFREHFLSKVLTIITTLVFLNMSFFLAEVSMLKLEQDSRFTKIISLILSGSGFEEEREVGGDHSKDEPTGKKVELIFNSHTHSHNGSLVLLANENRVLADHHRPQGGIYEAFSPPPESGI